VFTRSELEEIAAVVRDHNLLVISDEVVSFAFSLWKCVPSPPPTPLCYQYDRIVYENNEHVRIATLPGMWDRTVTLGSAGKTFSVTGWKVGWLIGSAPLIHAARLAHSRIAFCVATPLQDAIASGFEQALTNGFFEEQRQMLEAKKKTILKVFDDLGLPYSEPAGSYFTLVNTQKIKVPIEGEHEGESIHQPPRHALVLILAC